jgi:hypothetical protein
LKKENGNKIFEGMETRKLVPGIVFTFGGSPDKVRLLMADDLEIMYEPWSEAESEWYYKNVKQKIVYGRTSKQFAEQTLTVLGEEAYTSNDLEIHRPDLPLRLCRTKNIDWKYNLDDFSTFLKQVNSEKLDMMDVANLYAPEIVAEETIIVGGGVALGLLDPNPMGSMDFPGPFDDAMRGLKNVLMKSDNFAEGGAKWIWSKIPAATEISSGGCDEAASLIQKKIGGEIITIFNPISPRLKLGPVKYSGGEITDWYYHKAVRKGNTIYDRMTGPNGMHIDEYKKMFEFWDELEIK